MLSHNEKIKSDFEGTILDIETIEPFCWDYPHDDSRRYSKIIPIIIGYITKNELKILCAKGKNALDELKKEAIRLLPSMEKPLFAFQSIFERAVFYHCYNFKLKIDGELNEIPMKGRELPVQN